MMRRACAKNGHRWAQPLPHTITPFEVCERWFCEEVRVAPHVEEDTAATIEYLITTAPRRRRRTDAALNRPWRVL